MAETSLQKHSWPKQKTRLQGYNHHVEYFVRTSFWSACSSECPQAVKPMHCTHLCSPFPSAEPVTVWRLNTSNGAGREKKKIKTEREKKPAVISFITHMDANLG